MLIVSSNRIKTVLFCVVCLFAYIIFFGRADKLSVPTKVINNAHLADPGVDKELSAYPKKSSLKIPPSAFSFYEKQSREAELNKLANEKQEKILPRELYDALIRRGAVVDKDMALRMQTNSMTASDWSKIDIYAAELLSEEDNFHIELWKYKNFDEISSAFEQRKIKTGVFYGTDLLNEPNAYRGAKFGKIKEIIDSGAMLPEDFIKKAVNAGNIDLAIQLKAAGYNVNADFIDKHKLMNAIELQVENYALNPYGFTYEDGLNDIQKLIDLGVPLKVGDGTRDALDLALYGAYNQEGEEAVKLIMLAKKLHDLGLPIEPSHEELIAQIKNNRPYLSDQFADFY